MTTNCKQYPRKGQITTVELNTVMKSLGLDSTEDDLKAMIGILLKLGFCTFFQTLLIKFLQLEWTEMATGTLIWRSFLSFVHKD